MSENSSVLRGAIVGCGFFGEIQMEAWRRMEGVEIVASCDMDLERAARFSHRPYSSLSELLDREQVDFLDIATQPATHLPLVTEAAARRIPTICQKPLAPSWDEAVQLVRVVEEAGIPFMVHENWRWQPWYRVVRDSIGRGDIGAPITYLFRMRKADGYGPAPYKQQPYFRQMKRYLIHETLVHAIDVSRFLFGDVDSVVAEVRRRNPVIAGEDQAMLLLRHADGLPGCIDGHRFLDLAPDSPPLGDTVIEGESGLLQVTPAGDVLLGGSPIWTNTCTQGYRGDSVRATQDHFLHGLRTGEPFESTGADYLKTFAVVEAAYRSVENGARVRLHDVLSAV
ncbi:MAG: Gfo/Idh/MocA family protein [Bryobacteraceae bacterium]